MYGANKFYSGINIVSKCVLRFSSCNRLPPLFYYRSDWHNTLSRNFNSTCCTKAVENEFAHWVFENNPAYSQTIYVPKTEDSVCNNVLDVVNWENYTAEDIVKTLKLLSCKNFNVLDISLVDNLSAALRNVCPQFNDAQIIESLKYFINWRENSKEFLHCTKVWVPLDIECVKRTKKWDIKTALLVMDLLYLCYLEKKSRGFVACMMSLTGKIKYLSHTELIQSMFYLSLNSKSRALKGIFEYEYCLSKFIEELSIEEISIICMGFVMAQKPFYIPTMYDILLKKTIDNMDTIKSVALNAILRMLQANLPASFLDQLNMLIDKALPNIERLSLCCCVNLLLVGSSKPIFHKGLMDIVSNRFVNEIETASIKDIERMTSALYVYNHHPDTQHNIYEAIIEEIHNPARSNDLFTTSFSKCLAYLAMKNIYCDLMTDFVLNSKVFTKVYGKKLYLGNELLLLDSCVQINRALYEGHHLSKDIKKFITKQIRRQLPSRYKEKQPVSDQLLIEVFLACEKVFGKENVSMKHLLPHFKRADVVLGIRGNKYLIPIPDFLSEHKVGDIIYAPDFKDDDIWYALVIGCQNHFFLRTETYTGYIEAKLSQLQKIGYHPVLIPWFDWVCLTSAGKKDYVREIIFKKETQDDTIETVSNV